MQYMRTLEGFSRRLEEVDSKLDKILDGEKLYLDPDKPDEKRFIDLIHSFYPLKFKDAYDRNIDAKPQMYYITPQNVENGHEALLLKCDTSVHPLHTNLVKSAERVTKLASGRFKIENLIVAGADPHFRHSSKYNDFFEQSNNILLHANGDVVSLSQTVKALKRILERDETQPHAIFIDNTTGRFSAFLNIVFGLDNDESVDWLNDQFREKMNGKARLSVMSTQGQGIDRIDELAFDKEKSVNDGKKLEPPFEHLFLATSSPEKIDITARTVAQSSQLIEVHSAKILPGGNESGEELTGTFGGNALDKLKLILKQKLSHPRLDETLEKMGVTPETASIMVADGGEVYAVESVQNVHVFDAIRHEINPFAEFPGQETKPLSKTVGNGSKEAYYSALEKAFEEVCGDNLDLRAVDNCVILIAPLAQDNPDDPYYYAFKNKALIDLTFEPQPNFDAHPNQFHFQKPRGIEKTYAELEHDGDESLYRADGLAVSGALILAAKASGIPTKQLNLKADFDQRNNIPVSSPWEPQNKNAILELLKEQGIDYQAPKQPLESFDDVRKYVSHSDGYFFAGEEGDSVKTSENYWLSHYFAPVCPLVGKQLDNPDVNGKPIVFLQDKDTNNDLGLMHILNHLKKSGLVDQELEHSSRGLLRSFTDIQKAGQWIRKQTTPSDKFLRERKTARRAELPEIQGPSVLHLLSASSEAMVDNNDAYISAVNWALNGYNLMSGMGAQHPMGWYVYGGLQAKREGFDIAVQGIQDPYAVDVEGMPKVEMDILMGPGHALIAPDIFVRIEQLLQLDKLEQKLENDPNYKHMVVSHANGIGGFQEIAGIMALKEMGYPGIESLHLIINNHPRSHADKEVAPHDALVDLLKSRDEMDKVYVCDSVQGEISLAGSITGSEFVFYDVQRPVITPYPFARVANPYYDWFMGQKGEQPAETIRDVYENAQKARVDESLEYEMR